MEGPSRVTPTAAEIETWIVDRVAALTGAPPSDIDVQAPLTRHGVDSVALVSLVGDLEKWLGYRFRENPVATYPTIASLSQFLAAEVGRGSQKK